MITAGRRDEILRVFKEPDADKTDDFGDPIRVPEDVIPEYHVALVHRTVREIVSGDAETPRERYVAMGLYDTRITADMKVAWDRDGNGGEVIYEIEHVDHRREKDETHLLITRAGK